jgi:hypothetical protein
MRPLGQPNEISQIFATLLGKLLLELQISGGSVKKNFETASISNRAHTVSQNVRRTLLEESSNYLRDSQASFIRAKSSYNENKS